MSLRDKMKMVTELMQNTKTDWVATNPENPDIAIYLHFWRGDELIAAVQCPVDRDNALQAGQMAAAGFGATTMSMSFESYHSSEKESPATGQPWKPHEMQFLFETSAEAREKGWVHECISTMVHERGGDYGMYSRGYKIVDHEVQWFEELDHYFITGEQEPEQEQAAGVIFEFLQQAMATPTIEEILTEESEKDPTAALLNGLITDPETRLFHTDMATVKAMEEKKVCTAIVVRAQKGSRREQMLIERLGAPNVMSD